MASIAVSFCKLQLLETEQDGVKSFYFRVLRSVVFGEVVTNYLVRTEYVEWTWFCACKFYSVVATFHNPWIG